MDNGWQGGSKERQTDRLRNRQHFHRDPWPLTHRSIYTQTPLHKAAFIHRSSLYTGKPLHSSYYTAFTQSSFYTKQLYTQTLLHREAFTQSSFYTQTPLHTDAFPHRSFYTGKPLHRAAFTHRSISAFTQKPFTHRHFYAEQLYT